MDLSISVVCSIVAFVVLSALYWMWLAGFFSRGTETPVVGEKQNGES